MNKALARFALIIAAASPLSVAAQQKAPTGPTAAKQKSEQQPPLERVLPEIKFDGISLGDVVDFLRDVSGGSLKIVLVRPQGMNPADDPAVTLHLRDASLGQVLEVLKRECPIEISTVPPTKPGEGEVTVVKIVGAANGAADAGAAPVVRVYRLATIVAALQPEEPSPPGAYGGAPLYFPGQSGPMFVPGLPGITRSPAAPATAPTEADLAKMRADEEKASKAEAEAQAAARAAAEKARKKALDDLLSLCKAALDQVGGNTHALLQIHEPTQTLIFKGSPEQEAALEDVLNALDPNRGHADKAVVRAHDESVAQATSEVRAQLKQAHQQEMEQLKAQENQIAAQAEERVQDLQMRNHALEDRLVKQQAEVLEQEREMERLKIRLEAAEKGPVGGGSAPAEPKGKDPGAKQ